MEGRGKSVHDLRPAHSHVDLNRAGVPLMDRKRTRPPQRRRGGDLFRRLRDILVYLEVCDGNMEEGSFRCDANVSIRPVGEVKLGTKVELKNMNSFRFVEKAIEYEIERQEAVIRDGGKVSQETRLWDNVKHVTESMRSKEEAHDYRYFPDPDLLPLEVSRDWVIETQKKMPELAHQKATRFVEDYGIPEYDAGVLTSEKAVAFYFEELIKTSGADPKRASNVIMTELLGLAAKGEKPFETIPPTELGKALSMVSQGTISGKMLKDVIAQMHVHREGAESVVSKMGTQLSDTDAIEALIDQVIAANPENLAQYKAGKEKLFGFFVGQVMKESKGKANPQVVNDLLKKKLS
jgi:aspartyl-tRNA(Asn)/glutamyl-tRNA(Gln) amidotransferase subunit B